MSLNWRQFELGVLRPALINESEVAVKLVGETIWHESDQLRALGQYPGVPDGIFGPGLGIASIEEPTWNWMVNHPSCFWSRRGYRDLIWDLRLNVVACRYRYRLDPRPLPTDPGETGLLARSIYWLKAYNGSRVEARMVKYYDDAREIPWQRL